MTLDDDVSALTGDSANLKDASNLFSLRDNGSDQFQEKSMHSIIQPSDEEDGQSQRLEFDPDRTPIYGREAELAQLEASFVKTKSIDRQLVLLEGTAGAGKSSLAYQLRRTVAQQGGFFLGGKYEQSSSTAANYQSGDEPYAAVTMACRELCCALLAHRASSQSDENSSFGAGCSQAINWNFTFEDVQTKLHAELESSVIQALTTVFPDLTQILGGNFLADSTDNHIDYNEAKEQFKYAIRRFLRIISTFGQMVLFLDDVQWADTASLELLKDLITDCKVASSDSKQTSPSAEFKEDSDGRLDKGIMVLASYRTDEVPEEHPLRSTLLEIEKEVLGDGLTTSYSVDISKVTVQNLQVHQVNELLKDVLKGSTLEETLPLAECIHHKTEGNALYVTQFLMSLSSECLETPLITFNGETSKWQWDVEEIRVSQSATQNVVHMIQQKLQRLPEGFRQLLPVVALLGASFEYDTLDRVIRHFNRLFQCKSSSAECGDLSTRAFVAMAEREGVLMMDRRKKGVRFGHDKIQEAALELVEGRELSKLGIQLGRLFMESFTEEEQERNIFIIVNLLTVDPTSVMTDENRIFLVALNLKAGVRSLRSTAVASATGYMECAIALLPDCPWNEHYDLCLELHSTAAQAHFSNGEFEKAKGCCNEIYAQFGMPSKDRQRADLVTINIFGAQGQSLLAQEECIRQLAELGCKFPKHGQALYIMGGIMKVEMTVKSLERQIQNLPMMTDSSKQWIMRLLDRLATYTYQTKSDLFVLVVLRSLQYTLKYGICDYTPPVFCTVGILLGGVLGDHNANNRFGEIAIQQYRKLPTLPKTAYARTVFLASTFNMPLHHHNLRKSFFEGYKDGMALGDLESALWMIVCYVEASLHAGMTLGPLEKNMSTYTKQIAGLNHGKIGIPSMALWQCASNLLGYSDPCGEDEADNPVSLALEDGSQSDNTIGFVHRCRLINAFYCGDYSRVASLYVKHGLDKGEWDKLFMSAWCLPTLHFHCAIALFACFHDTKMKSHKKTALKEAKMTLGLSTSGNPFFKHYGTMVNAEKLALDKKSFSKAESLFKEAIQHTRMHKIVNDEALANERLAELYLRHGMIEDALEHFTNASQLYEKWGSVLRSKAVLCLRGRTPASKLAKGFQAPSAPLFSNGAFVVS